MKIIISPAKTISKTAKSFDLKEKFCNETLEILKEIPDVKLSNELYQAFFMYDGLCFRSMERASFDESDLKYVEKNLFILSALYGAVKAFDLISPYRLDFLMKVEIGNLYKFWGEKISKKVLKDENLIVNLASNEFSKLIKKYITTEKFLDIEFFEKINGRLKKHSTISKKGRGKMLLFMTKNKIEKIEDLKNFNLDGYKFEEKLSSAEKFVFVKNL